MYDDLRKSMMDSGICESDVEAVLEMIRLLHGENEIEGFKLLEEEEFQESMKPDPEWERKFRERIDRAQNDRDNHVKSEHKPHKVPLLWIRDKGSGKTHLYGMDTHDSLYISADEISYYNLQNGDGTGDGGGYEFVDHDTEGMTYNQVLHYYLDSGEIG